MSASERGRMVGNRVVIFRGAGVGKLVTQESIGDSRGVAKLPRQLHFPFPPESSALLEAKVVDLGAARRRLRPAPIDGRQAIVLTLVEQLAGLVRGTTSPERAGAVRRAASH